MIWLTSDTEFFNSNIIEYANRPYKDVQEMNDKLVHNWNYLVKESDMVYHLGNFGRYGIEGCKIYNKLNGRIVLVRGNDDASLLKLMDMGFDGICDSLTLSYKQYVFTMTHEPLIDTMFDQSNHGLINLHGKIRGCKRAFKNRIHVGCDAWNYQPVSLDEIISEYKKSRKQNVLYD